LILIAAPIDGKSGWKRESDTTLVDDRVIVTYFLRRWLVDDILFSRIILVFSKLVILE
jgi:hypothetical protein